MDDQGNQGEAGTLAPVHEDMTGADLVELQAKHDEMAGRLTGLTVALAERGIVLEPGADITAVAIEAIDKLQADNKAIGAEARKLKRDAKAELSAERGRKVGPIKHKVEGRDDEDGPVSAEGVLLEMIKAADTVEVAFSDGKSEIGYFPALVVSGEDAWAQTAAGVKLTIDPLEVVGGPKPTEIRGYGLILDGKQVAWRDTGPHKVAANHKWNLAGDVVFTG